MYFPAVISGLPRRAAAKKANANLPTGCRSSLCRCRPASWVAVPVDANVHETKYIAKYRGQQQAQGCKASAVRHPDFQHHDNENDGGYSVAKRLQSPFVHETRPVSFSESKFSPSRVGTVRLVAMQKRQCRTTLRGCHDQSGQCVSRASRAGRHLIPRALPTTFPALLSYLNCCLLPVSNMYSDLLFRKQVGKHLPTNLI